ncbi:hypothetical protein DFH09DRAFT_1182266 [Mycena vulgaris]|nr:hypothetical protein DFH09DRAFT_1182266 [Mycena vulgaris]
MESIDTMPYSYTSLRVSSAYLPHPAERARLHALLRSNCPPPPATDPQTHVVPSLAKVAEYDVEIVKLQELMNRMVADRAILQYHADGYCSLYAPIRHLPDEILVQIFDYCCPPAPPRPLDLWDGLPRAETTDRIAQRHLRQLAEVCGSWRELVLGTPLLWSTIELDLVNQLSEAFPRDEERRIVLLRSSLELSASTPLRIHVRVPSVHHHLPFTERTAVTLLAQSSARWRDAMIDVKLEFALLAPAKGNLPVLKSLHIFGTMPDDFDVFEIAPELTDLTLEQAFPPHPKLPWGQLRTVCFTALQPEDLSAALSHLSRCPKLTKLSLYQLHMEEEEDIPQLPSFVLDIHTFNAVFFLISGLSLESPVADKLLQSLTLRCASVVQLKCFDTPLVWPQRAFVALASRSSFHENLKSLEIFNMLISAADLLQCLAGLPRLEELIVSDPIYWMNGHSKPAVYLVTNELLRGLTWTSDAVSLVPLLHAFECETLFQFEPQTYLDLITSRLERGRDAHGPFQTALFRTRGGYVDPALVERLSELVLRKELKLKLEHDYLEYRWPLERCNELL